MFRSNWVLYGLPSLAFSVPLIPLSLYLPAFYAEDMALGFAIVGAVMFVSRLVDMISDPIAGYISDRFAIVGTYRKGWIVIGGILCGLSMYQITHPAEGAGWFYLAIWSVLLYVGWTFVNIPYLAWGAELSDDYKDRSKITLLREGLALCGILLALIMPVLLGSDDPLKMIVMMSISLGVVSTGLLCIGVPEKQSIIRQKTVVSFKGILKNPLFVRLISSWFLISLSNGIPAVLFVVYLETVLQVSEDVRNILILIYFVAAVIGMPLWAWLGRKYRKHHILAGAMFGSCIAFLVVPFLGPEDVNIFLVICIVTGVILGAEMALPPSIQADVVDYDRYLNNQDRAGVYFAFWGMIAKLALACAIGVAFGILGATESLFGKTDQRFITSVSLTYALLPLILKTFASYLMWNFPFSQRRENLIRQKLRINIK